MVFDFLRRQTQASEVGYPNVAPAGGFEYQDPLKGKGFLDQMQYFQQNNPEVLMNFAAGMFAGDTGAAIKGASSAIGATRKEEMARQGLAVQQNKTREFLIAKGYSPEEADAAINDPVVLRSLLAGKESSLINAGDGNLYDPSTGEWIQAPNSGNRKAPTVVELFDEETGQPYKAQWNVDTGEYERIGGTKAPTQKSPTEQVNRARQLYTVTKPEADALLGNATTPGTYDNLTVLRDQAGNIIAGGLQTLTGADASAYMTSPGYQQAKNAIKTIYASYIYSVSGATAPTEEVERVASSLMPSPGESAKSIQDKKTRLKRYVDSIGMMANGTWEPDAGDLKPGDVEDGYRYLGGDRSDPNSWEPE